MKMFVRIMATVMMMSIMIVLIYSMIQPQLKRIVETKDNLQPASEPKQQEQKPLQAINANDPISYSLQNNQLHITFDKGSQWILVPVEQEVLFNGEYNGNKQELIPNSYILSESRVAFLYSDGVSWDRQRIFLTYTVDQGKTWKESVIAENFSVMRFRKVAFLNDQFGYVIISGGRTMSQESSHVFLTLDGGETWTEMTNSGITRLIADGGFVDETTGFLSFGTINPEAPDFYMTEDAGNTWIKSEIHIPGKYQRIFVIAETPVKEGDHLTLLVNQGPNGDYEGGRVKGKFVSTDNGKSWEFLEEVKPSDTE